MAQFIVKAKKMNVRRVVPGFLPDPVGIVGIVNENFVFEGEEVLDVPNPGLGKWYRDRNGNFYWGGGVSVFNESIQTSFNDYQNLNFIPSKMSWGHKLFDIPFIWKDLKTAGRQTTIAVIDTGIDTNHLDLKNNIHPLSRSFVGDVDSIIDEHGHGTSMAGIIAANGADKIYGVAPEAKLLIVKGTINKNGVNLENFAEAINFAASIPEVDIISISYSPIIDHPVFKNAILHSIQTNKIIIAAMGNGHINPTGPDDDTFPACYNPVFPDKTGILSIGAFNNAGNLSAFSNWSNHLRCLAPGEAMLTTKIGNATTNENGTSIATAFTAGCMALMVSYSKLNNRKTEDCVSAILDTCDDIGAEIGFDFKSGYGSINLRNAISKIK